VYLARDLAVLDVAMRVLERVVYTTLGDLSERVNKGSELTRLRVGNSKDGVRVLVHRMDDLHRLAGLGPLSADQVGDSVGLGGRAERLGINRSPGRSGRHTAKR
jgi:hypothetical protein